MTAMLAVAPAEDQGGPAAPVSPTPPTADPGFALDGRIRAESVVWLTTVSADGRPHVVPVWFDWDGGSFLVFTKPEAKKVRNIRSNPAVMLALGEPRADFDVVLIEAEAEILDEPTSGLAPMAYFDRYAAWMAAIGLSRSEFVATYSLAFRIRPTRYLGWAGRTHLSDRQTQTQPVI
jgi:PPOX class probable F420-dependent enzyme